MDGWRMFVDDAVVSLMQEELSSSILLHWGTPKLLVFQSHAGCPQTLGTPSRTSTKEIIPTRDVVEGGSL